MGSNVMSHFSRRVIGIVTAADKSAIELEMTNLLGYDCTDVFSIPLSSNGNTPITHYGASAQITLDERNALLPLFAPGNPQGRRGWRGIAYAIDDINNIPILKRGDVTSNNPNERWTFEKVLEETGLQIINNSIDIDLNGDPPALNGDPIVFVSHRN
jgi:hypothetical protein